GYEFAIKGARNSGTPFISFYTPDEMLELARTRGLREARYVPQSELARYFAGRPDGLRPSTGEPLVVART
ncbi:MAG TPA: SAM-dependent methyltransferase, partial [Chloroflexota bacterium]|nr:SAM-dependent methyltransferase [Chloroflexota bacterium]